MQILSTKVILHTKVDQAVIIYDELQLIGLSDLFCHGRTLQCGILNYPNNICAFRFLGC